MTGSTWIELDVDLFGIVLHKVKEPFQMFQIQGKDPDAVFSVALKKCPIALVTQLATTKHFCDLLKKKPCNVDVHCNARL